MRISLIVHIIANFLIITGVSIVIFTFMPILLGEIMYRINKPEQVTVTYDELNPDEVASTPDIQNILPYDPVDKNFSIMIPSIEVNAPVIPEVSTIKENEYMDALRKGVAHAVGTSLPGEEGNIFMFAHSSLNFWQLGPYATVFNLLNKLEKGDIIVLYYQGNVYEYAVFENETVPGWNTSPFDAEYDESVLTLITCDPPGTTINRRVVKARLLNEISSIKTQE